MSLRRKKLPIKHIVIYLGDETPTMRTQLEPHEIYTGFELLNVKTIDKNEFLSSQIPEEILMAVLANYESQETEIVLRQILNNLRRIVKNKRTLKKYINQLMMLSRLRKIEALTIKIAEEMPIHIDFETDTLYLRGTEKGVEKERRQNVINMWLKGIIPTMISNLLNLPLEQIERFIIDFQNEKK